MAIIRFEQNGPSDTGLASIELDAEDFQSDLPEQKWYIYHEDTVSGLIVGVWTTTSMQESFGPYPGDEFMYILEGKVAMMDSNNNATNIQTGETFVVRNGIPVSWRQEGFCRKFFMLFLPPDKPTPEIETVNGGIKILREHELEAKFVSSKSSSGACQYDAEVFINDERNMSAGMWETEAFESKMEPFPIHEFAQMLHGDVSISEADGTIHEFTSGDCFFIPAGTVCSWKSDGPFRKYYCNLSPSAAA